MSIPSSFRLLPIGALAVSCVLTGGVGIAVAQLVSPVRTMQPSRAEVIHAAVSEASLRFGVPEHWIRAVMRVESANNPRAVSGAGAIGLMQVMPATYAGLRRRYGLGADPFDPRDNILAGTAYLREMHDRYGRTGMLAAYNAGPGRWEEHLRAARRLPLETIGYLARLGPMIGARTLSMAANARVERSPVAPPQTIFVSFGDGATAVAVQPVGRTDGVHAVVELPPESVFVRRTASAQSSSNDASLDSADAPANPLFARVGGVGGGQ